MDLLLLMQDAGKAKTILERDKFPPHKRIRVRVLRSRRSHQTHAFVQSLMEGRRQEIRQSAEKTRLKSEKKAAQDLISMTNMQTQQFAHKATAAPVPVAVAIRTHFGDPEINSMFKDQQSETYAQLHENVRRKIAALG